MIALRVLSNLQTKEVVARVGVEAGIGVRVGVEAGVGVSIEPRQDIIRRLMWAAWLKVNQLQNASHCEMRHTVRLYM